MIFLSSFDYFLLLLDLIDDVESFLLLLLLNVFLPLVFVLVVLWQCIIGGRAMTASGCVRGRAKSENESVRQSSGESGAQREINRVRSTSHGIRDPLPE